MLETYKILNDLYDNEAAPVLELSDTKMTRGNHKNGVKFCVSWSFEGIFLLRGWWMYGTAFHRK